MEFINKINLSQSNEKKNIAIRGVDKDLFDKFMALNKVWGHNNGFIFSKLIQRFKKDTSIMFGPPYIRNAYESSLEIIRDLDEFVVTKNDLIEAGDTIRYYFKNIKHLKFTKLDNKILEKHVYRIQDCQVSMPNSISRLLLSSIIRSKMRNISTNKKLVTIRNVNTRIYDEFISTCQVHDQSLGDAVNELLMRFTPEVELHLIITHGLGENPLKFLSITSLEDLYVNSKDLNEIQQRRILFHRIKYLEFDQSITKEDFINKIVGIYNCKKVILPDSVPKLIRNSRIRMYPS